MGLFRTVSEIDGDFSRKSHQLSHPPPVYLHSRWRGSSWNWVPALEVENTRMMGLPGRERSLTISSAVWIQYTNVTDGQTPSDSKDRAHA